jgi:VanZ like family
VRGETTLQAALKSARIDGARVCAIPSPASISRRPSGIMYSGQGTEPGGANLGRPPTARRFCSQCHRLYMALSFCATMTLGYHGGRLRWALVVVLVGAAASMSFELTQYFIPGRYTSAMDVYADALGLIIGSSAGAYG